MSYEAFQLYQQWDRLFDVLLKDRIGKWKQYPRYYEK